jgi:Uma2 family endonuclease
MQPLDSADSPAIHYPDSDGKPMADNTEQARWIIMLAGNLEALFADRPDVFVAADNLWYPVQGNNKLCMAPNVYLAFGRPKGRRGSYKTWEEDGIPITVAFEVLSPQNTVSEMARKLLFYEEHGVEEYYVYDPDTVHLTIYTRDPTGAAFVARNPDTFVSPRMGIRFDTQTGPELLVLYPDGRPFRPFAEVAAERDEAQQRAEEALRALAQAAQRADTATRQRDEVARLAEQTRHQARRLRDLGRKARAGTATPEELAELDLLEQTLSGE